jgi:predicted nucleic acid-binding protein
MILVDTTPLVALCDAGDAQHDAAIKQLGKLASAGLCTCEAVLMEACFHLPHRAQRQRLRALLEALAIASLQALTSRLSGLRFSTGSRSTGNASPIGRTPV